MLVMLYETGQVYFRWPATNGFRLKAENGRFTVAGLRYPQNLKYEISRRHLPDYVKKLLPECAPHVQHDYFILIQPIMCLICDVVS